MRTDKDYVLVSDIDVSDKQSDLSWASLGTSVYIKVLVIGGLLWYLFREEMDGVVHRWVSDPSWSHGFLIPLFSLYFLNQHKKELLRLETRPNYIGLVFMILCIIFYPLNIVQFKFAYARPLTVVATLGTIVLFLGGWRLVRYVWLPVAYLIFAIPLPARLYRSITIPMRQFAAQIAAILLNIVPNLEATVNGVVIDVVYKSVRMEPGLDVAEACSGMRLLMAFLALGVAMAYLHGRPAWQRIVLLASTVPIAILCNVVRVTVTGFIYILWDPRYAQGIYHDMLGMAMLPLAFGFYGFLAWFMSNLFEPEDSIEQDVIVRRRD
ncbi:MAG TPA: exosortase/archaeosortase family protein [Planctomycetes bacterium]|nr:exosortase/archaeosortase family protein [Planctomycetota bacterium]